MSNLPTTVPDVGAYVAGILDDPGAGVAVGTFGALAEFVRPPGRPVPGPARGVHSHQETDAEVLQRHVAVTDGGAVRIDTSIEGLRARAWRRPTGSGVAWSHAVALCLPSDRAAGPGRTGVTPLGPDPDALLAGDDDEILVDLGLGVSHLEACVRTGDPALLALVRRAEGRPLDAELSAALVAAGPTRVFRTVAARVEVTTPIPPPTSSSPAGPHTHLLPALLAHRRTHAATDPIPDGHVPVATLFPPHPQHDALGRAHEHFDAVADAAFERALTAFGEPDELATARRVRDAISGREAAEAPPTSLSRAGRRGWEVELRRGQARGDTTPTWAAWRAAAGGGAAEGVPFHEAHA